MENKELIKKRIGLLPEGLKTFVLNDGWRLELNDISSGFGLDEEESTLVENEVFFVLLGFEPLEDLKNNIGEVISIDSNTADDLLGEIENKILKQNEEYLDRLWQVIENMGDEDSTNNQFEIKKPNTVGKSFEDTILNQARGMMPAIEGGQELEAKSLEKRNVNEEVQDTKYEIRSTSYEEGEKNNKPSVGVPNYGGTPYKNSTNYPTGDPYREPAE